VNALRYFLALVMVVSLPALFLYWLLIHPFVNFWRVKGIGATYGIVLFIILTAMLGLFSMRHFLLNIDFGTNYMLLGLGVLCLVLSGCMRFAIQRRLTIKTLLGFPEIAPERFSRKLITEGIYGRMRHPRYVQFLFALAGYAFIANYLALYFVVALWLPGIYIIVLLEEKELRDHFGGAYDEYCRKVPRFIPKFGPVGREKS